MGVEYAFLPNWSAKIEYNFIDFGSRSFSAPISTNPSLAGTPLAGLTATPFDHRKSAHHQSRLELVLVNRAIEDLVGI